MNISLNIIFIWFFCSSLNELYLLTKPLTKVLDISSSIEGLYIRIKDATTPISIAAYVDIRNDRYSLFRSWISKNLILIRLSKNCFNIFHRFSNIKIKTSGSVFYIQGVPITSVFNTSYPYIEAGSVLPDYFNFSPNSISYNKIII